MRELGKFQTVFSCACFWDHCVIALEYERFPLDSALIVHKYPTFVSLHSVFSRVSSKTLILRWETQTRNEERLFKQSIDWEAAGLGWQIRRGGEYFWYVSKLAFISPELSVGCYFPFYLHAIRHTSGA